MGEFGVVVDSLAFRIVHVRALGKDLALVDRLIECQATAAYGPSFEGLVYDLGLSNNAQ